jgi:hypothetical protein
MARVDTSILHGEVVEASVVDHGYGPTTVLLRYAAGHAVTINATSVNLTRPSDQYSSSPCLTIKNV